MNNHCAQKSLAERGGTPPLNGKNPLKRFWQRLLSKNGWVCALFYFWFRPRNITIYSFVGSPWISPFLIFNSYQNDFSYQNYRDFFVENICDRFEPLLQIILWLWKGSLWSYDWWQLGPWGPILGSHRRWGERFASLELSRSSNPLTFSWVFDVWQGSYLWCLAYQIIVADAADAVSVNFSGRCKFFQI